MIFFLFVADVFVFIIIWLNSQIFFCFFKSIYIPLTSFSHIIKIRCRLASFIFADPFLYFVVEHFTISLLHLLLNFPFFFVFVFSGEISFVLTCILSSVLILDFDWFCILKVFFKKSWFLKIPCLFSCSSELWNWSLYISRPWRQVWKPTSPGLLFHQSLLLVFV